MTHRIASLAAIAASSLALAACSSSGPSTEPSPPPSVSTAPSPYEPFVAQPVWSTDIGSESWSHPAVLGDVVVFGANDGIVRALDAQTGQLAWQAATGGALRGGVLAADDAVFVVSDDGSLYAFDESGDTLWVAAVGAAAPERGTYDNYGSRPAAADGVVYAATQSGSVAAVDQDTGAIIWSLDIGSPVEAGLAVGAERLHVSTMAGDHKALSITDGSLVWELPTGGPATTTPAIMGDQVLVGTRGANLLVRDEATGDKVWTAGYGGSWVQSGAVPLGDEALVIGSSDYKAVRAMKLEDGAPLWLARVGGWPWAIPAVADGVVYATELRLDYQEPLDTALWALDAETGEELWTAGGGLALEWTPDGYGSYGNGAGPVIAGDLVVVPGLDGVVRAFHR